MDWLPVLQRISLIMMWVALCMNLWSFRRSQRAWRRYSYLASLYVKKLSGEEPVIVNYMKLRSSIPFRVEYVYADRKDHLIDQILIDRGIRAKFRKIELAHPKFDGYCLCTCRVSSKHEQEMIEVFSELEKKMLLMGHTDYHEFCKCSLLDNVM